MIIDGDDLCNSNDNNYNNKTVKFKAKLLTAMLPGALLPAVFALYVMNFFIVRLMQKMRNWVRSLL